MSAPIPARSGEEDLGAGATNPRKHERSKSNASIGSIGGSSDDEDFDDEESSHAGQKAGLWDSLVRTFFLSSALYS
jgi:hypothetical protein